MKTPGIIKTIKTLFSMFGRTERLSVLVISIFSICTSCLEVCTAYVLVAFAQIMTSPQNGMKYLNLFEIKGDFTDGKIISIFAVGFCFIYFIKNIIATFEIFYQNITVQKMNYSFKNKLMQKYSAMDFSLYLTRNSSYGMNVISGDVEQTFSTGLTSIAGTLSEITVLIFLMVMVFAMNPLLAVILLGLSLVISLLMYRFILPKFYKWGEKLQSTGVIGYQQLIQFFHGFKEIVLFGKKDIFINGFNVYSKQRTRIQAIHSATNNMPRIIIETLFVCIFVAAVLFLCHGETDIKNIIGVLGGCLYLGFRVMPGFNRVISQLNSFKLVIPSINRVHEEFTKKEMLSKVTSVPALKFENSIHFKSVSYMYLNTNKNVLENVNFTIKKGESIGVFGETGSGKSTLMDLFLGLLKPTSGSIVVDDSYPVACEEWHKIIGYVPQAIYLIDDTIEANIAFGVQKEEINYNQLKHAIEAAQLSGLVEKLPDGVKTIVGERGVRLSGGERQRIAIARALYIQPQVLVFDEATSALDSKTEKSLMDTINKLSKNYTVIMVAHRISTLSKCDRFINVKNGKVYSQPTLSIANDTESLIEHAKK